MMEEMKFIGGVDFKDLRAQRIQVYNKITIDLAGVRADQEMVFTGNYIYGIEASDGTANIDIRLNEKFRSTINIKQGRGVRAPFYRFYVTNAAQAGKSLTLIIGVEAEQFEIIDNLTSIVVSGIIGTYQQVLGNAWVSEGPVTPVGADEILADTGQLVAGVYDFSILANQAGAYTGFNKLQHRNALNNASVMDHPGFSSYIETGGAPLAIKAYAMGTDERLRVVSGASCTSLTVVSIWWMRRT